MTAPFTLNLALNLYKKADFYAIWALNLKMPPPNGGKRRRQKKEKLGGGHMKVLI
jgi:hypothetical protein